MLSSGQSTSCVISPLALAYPDEATLPHLHPPSHTTSPKARTIIRICATYSDASLPYHKSSRVQPLIINGANFGRLLEIICIN